MRLSNMRRFGSAQHLERHLGGHKTLDTGDSFGLVVDALLELATAEDAEKRAAIGQGGFIPPLVGLLREQAASDQVQDKVARILTKITFNDETRDHVASIPGVVSSLLRMLRQDAFHAEPAAAVLRNLALSPKLKHSIREKGQMRPVLDLLTHEDLPETTVRKLIGIVRNMATSRPNQDALRHGNAIPLLIGFLQSPDVEVAIGASHALNNLAVENADNKTAINKAGGIPLLVALLKPGSKTALAATEALGTLSVGHAKNKDDIRKADGVKQLQTLDKWAMAQGRSEEPMPRTEWALHNITAKIHKQAAADKKREGHARV